MFLSYHKLMEVVVAELAANLGKKLLAKYGDAPGVC